jgi:hypothetical protein
VSTEAGCSPAPGQLLAGRYRLDTPVSERSERNLRLWRGFDEVLNRPVAVKVQEHDVGDGDLLSAAIATGRVVHPHIASVYDAARVGDCTYVVSEWVDGRPLPDLLREGPLEPAEATELVRQAAEAIAALHAYGLVHDNLHPENVLVTDDGEVKLTDLHATRDADTTGDVRALGTLLYAALTDRWPDLGPGIAPPGIAPAPCENDRPYAPRQVRAGVPVSLSTLAMDALAPAETAPTAALLAAELGRHVDPDGTGTMPVVEDYIPEGGTASLWRRILIPLAAVVLICAAGALIGIKLGAIPTLGRAYPSFASDGTRHRSHPAPLQTLGVVQAKMLDPSPNSDHTEGGGLNRAYDGRASTAWHTDVYTTANYGNLKKGMGIAFDLGTPSNVSQVRLTMLDPGATVELMTSNRPGTGPADFHRVALVRGAGRHTTFTPPSGTTAQYWAIWITRLPRVTGGYQARVADVRFATR